ncbi:MAG TPA: hypothetical protein VIH07_05100 [Candidatus Humimicrobiaceae bacterium]
MINAILKSYEKTNVGANYLFETDVSTLANYIKEFFEGEGYKLEEGTPEKGGYIKGSMGMRIMFGGLANRYKFNVNITYKDGMTHLELTRGMTGVSGGLIGYGKMGNEISRIREKINTESIHK